MHAHSLAYVALANASAHWQLGNVECLSGRDISGYDFLSVTKEGFVPVSVQPISEPWLNNMMV